jgi:hypothetical protein
MKKIITLAIAIAAVSSVFAQSQDDRARAKDKVFGNHTGTTYPSNYPTTYPTNYPQSYPASYPTNYPNGYPQGQADQINRDFNARIASVQNNPYLSRSEKARQIRELNAERERTLHSINNQYGYDNGRRRDRDDDRYEDRNHDHGRHLGWEKGRGNPHRD